MRTIRKPEFHGDKHTKEYKTWKGIRQRCFNPNNHDFHHYGGRGITICDKWDKYTEFIKDMGRAPSPKHSIDRIDFNGNYEPRNCRWVTHQVQVSNSRHNHVIEFNGQRRTLSEWARFIGIKPSRLSDRINTLGWSIEDALSKKVDKHVKLKSEIFLIDGVGMTKRQACIFYGINVGTVYSRTRTLNISFLDALKMGIPKQKKTANEVLI